MAAPVVNAAFGTTIAHGVTGTYTALLQVVSLDGPSSEMGTRETTHLTSANSAKTYAKTLFDGGEVSGQLEIDPKGDTHSVWLALFYSNTQVTNGEQWQMTFVDAGVSKATFLGILTKFNVTGVEMEANLLADFTIKISGVVTWS